MRNIIKGFSKVKQYRINLLILAEAGCSEFHWSRDVSWRRWLNMLRYFAANGCSGYWLVIWWFTAVALLLGQKGTKRNFPVRQYFALCDGSFKIELIYVTNWIRSAITDKTTVNVVEAKHTSIFCVLHCSHYQKTRMLENIF